MSFFSSFFSKFSMLDITGDPDPYQTGSVRLPMFASARSNRVFLFNRHHTPHTYPVLVQGCEHAEVHPCRGQAQRPGRCGKGCLPSHFLRGDP